MKQIQISRSEANRQEKDRTAAEERTSGGDDTYVNSAGRGGRWNERTQAGEKKEQAIRQRDVSTQQHMSDAGRCDTALQMEGAHTYLEPQ